jgi:hypothetical protein
VIASEQPTFTVTAPDTAVPALQFLGGSAGREPTLLRPAVILIGSKPESYIQLRSPQVSGAHALLLNCGSGRLHLRDLHSGTGVNCNGEAVRRARVRHGTCFDSARSNLPWCYRAAPPPIAMATGLLYSHPTSPSPDSSARERP